MPAAYGEIRGAARRCSGGGCGISQGDAAGIEFAPAGRGYEPTSQVGVGFIIIGAHLMLLRIGNDDAGLKWFIATKAMARDRTRWIFLSPLAWCSELLTYSGASLIHTCSGMALAFSPSSALLKEGSCC